MAKSKPGLPEGYEINLTSPSQLGDYLDEGYDETVARAFVAKQRIVATPVEQKVEAPIVRAQPLPQQPPQEPRPQIVENQNHSDRMRNDQVLNLADARRRAAPRTQAFKRPERIQFNLRPETQKMFGEIVEFVQRYSMQEDAKASEILDALISALYEAREGLAFHDVPRRGKWGTPTARAFPTALGNAFARAIAGIYAKSGRGE